MGSLLKDVPRCAVGEPQQKKKVVYGRKKPGVRRQGCGISEEGQLDDAEPAAQQQAEEARLQQEQEVSSAVQYVGA